MIRHNYKIDDDNFSIEIDELGDDTIKMSVQENQTPHKGFVQVFLNQEDISHLKDVFSVLYWKNYNSSSREDV